MNKNNYKNLFNKINISDDKIEEIKTMPLETRSSKRSFKANFATALAVLIGVFVVSNGITYAATGDSIVKKVADTISNYEADETLEKYKTGEYIDEEGNAHYQYEADGAEIEAVINESALEDESLYIKSTYEEDDNDGEKVHNIVISPSETDTETTSTNK